MKKVLQSLKCEMCKTRIRPPFRMCKDMHLICTNCNVHLEVTTGTVKPGGNCSGTEVELKIFNTLFIDTYDHCQYNCGFFGELLELNEHEKECEFVGKSTKCLIGNCQWVGSTTLLVQHVDTDHPQQLVHLSSEKSFTTEFSTSTKLVLQFDNDYFMNYLYWSHILEINEQMYIMIHHLDRHGPPVYPDVTLDEYEISTSKEWNTLSKIKMVQTKDIPEDEIRSTDFIQRNGTNVAFLRSKTYIVKMSSSEEVILPEMVMFELECTICTEIMFGQIKMCSRGHSFCENCVKKLKKCPDCKGSISKSRNYKLEGLTMKLFQQCKYHEAGCLLTCSSEKMEKHVRHCVYKPITCDLCNWKGPYLKFQDHYNLDHEQLQQLLIPYSFEISENDFDGEMFHIGLNNFMLTSIYRDQFYFAVDHITEEDKSEFHFDITFFNPETEHGVQFSLPCRTSRMYQIKEFKYTANDDNVCVIPKKLFNEYIQDEQKYCYVLNIYKA